MQGEPEVAKQLEEDHEEERAEEHEDPQDEKMVKKRMVMKKRSKYVKPPAGTRNPHRRPGACRQQGELGPRRPPRSGRAGGAWGGGSAARPPPAVFCLVCQGCVVGYCQADHVGAELEGLIVEGIADLRQLRHGG